jgi:signal transduction histidine kinase
MLLASIDKRAIRVSMDIAMDVPVIMGDHTKLMQVVLNLLKNSIEAIPLNAAEKTISIRLYAQEGLLILEVQDSGNGFDETTAGRLFERGFTTKSTGSGLGLNNCRAIIESHSGTIGISSKGIGNGALTMVKFKAA